MEPIADLKEEHRGIEIMLGIMGGVISKTSKGQLIDSKDFDSILEFLSVFVEGTQYCNRFIKAYIPVKKPYELRQGCHLAAFVRQHMKTSMPVDGHSTGISCEWETEQAEQGKLLWIAELGKIDHHVRMPLGWLILVCAQQSVPPGQVKSGLPSP